MRKVAFAGDREFHLNGLEGSDVDFASPLVKVHDHVGCVCRVAALQWAVMVASRMDEVWPKDRLEVVGLESHRAIHHRVANSDMVVRTPD
jgi:hypothetical protein